MASTQRSIERLAWRFFLLLFSAGLAFGCDRPPETPIKVSLSQTEKKEPLPQTQTKQTKIPLRVAISAIISPSETFVLYKDMLDYISKKLDMPVQLFQRETYGEVNNLVRDNELDLAFVCTGAYIDGHDRFGMELLVAPVAYGESVYHSYIIVPKDSKARSLEDLRHKQFAFTDPLSNTGKLAPTYMLARMHEEVDSFFSKYIFTYSHDRSIEMVAHSLVDGAAVDGLIWEYMNSKAPTITSKTKIIKKSEAYGIPPVVVPPGLDQTLKESMRDLFLNMHTDAEGKKILAKLRIDKFVVADNSWYDSVRKMQSWARQ